MGIRDQQLLDFQTKEESLRKALKQLQSSNSSANDELLQLSKEKAISSKLIQSLKRIEWLWSVVLRGLFWLIAEGIGEPIRVRGAWRPRFETFPKRIAPPEHEGAPPEGRSRPQSHRELGHWKRRSSPLSCSKNQVRILTEASYKLKQSPIELKSTKKTFIKLYIWLKTKSCRQICR